MLINERLEDISKRCGVSEEMVRRVLLAERDSAIASLKEGESVLLLGRVVMKPIPNRKREGELGVKLSMTYGFRDAIMGLPFKDRKEKKQKGVRIAELEMLK